MNIKYNLIRLFISVFALSTLFIQVHPEIASAQVTTTRTTACYMFSNTLNIGSTGADVVALQSILVGDGFLTMPAGEPMGTYDSVTAAAVSKYQTSIGIPATGFLGALTIAALNGCGNEIIATTTCPVNFTCTSITAPSFSVNSAPTLVWLITTGGAATTTNTVYTATFNVTANSGSGITTLGSPSFSIPAFSTSYPYLTLYKNGVVDTNASDILNLHVAYSAPTNAPSLDNGQLFMLVPNQSVVIPVTYTFSVVNPGPNVYGVALTNAAYSNSTSTSASFTNSPITNACAGTCSGSVTTPPPPVNPPVATVTGQPTLVLTYDQRNTEAMLTATFKVSINGGSTGTGVYENTAGGVLFTGANGDTSASAVNQKETIVPTIQLPTTTDPNGATLYSIPAGQTATFTVTDSVNPQLLFAGAYVAKLQGISTYYNGYSELMPSANQTNSKTIVGEITPYISSVTTPISPGQRMTITGQRLFGSNNPTSIMIDNTSPVRTSVGIIPNGTALSFIFPSVVAGSHTLYLNSPNGKSNIVAFQVQGTQGTTSPATSPSASISGQPTLNLSYGQQQKESLLTANFNVVVKGGSQGVNIYKNAGGISFFNSNGSSAQANSESPTAFTPIGGTSVQTVYDNYNQAMYSVGPNQSVTFQAVATIEPSQLFAGTYYAAYVTLYVNPGTDISNAYNLPLPSNKTNSKTIVGETSPYITSVTTPISSGQKMTITGQRLNGAQINIDNAPLSNMAIVGPGSGTSLSFTLPSLSTGSHLISVNNQGTGKSNQVAFQVNGSVSTTTGTSTGQSPVITGGAFPASLTVGQTATWTINASNPQNGILSYSVNWGDNGAQPAVAPKAVIQTTTFTHSYSAAGTYTVTFTVTNSAGLSAEITSTVVVTNTATSTQSVPARPTAFSTATAGTANIFTGFYDFLQGFIH